MVLGSEWESYGEACVLKFLQGLDELADVRTVMEAVLENLLFV